jgi:hypothetical protein
VVDRPWARKHGLNYPYHWKQIAAWIDLISTTVFSVICILEFQSHNQALKSIFLILTIGLTLSIIFLGYVCTTTDPTDPNVYHERELLA